MLSVKLFVVTFYSIAIHCWVEQQFTTRGNVWCGGARTVTLAESTTIMHRYTFAFDTAKAGGSCFRLDLVLFVFGIFSQLILGFCFVGIFVPCFLFCLCGGGWYLCLLVKIAQGSNCNVPSMVARWSNENAHVPSALQYSRANDCSRLDIVIQHFLLQCTTLNMSNECRQYKSLDFQSVSIEIFKYLLYSCFIFERKCGLLR